MLLTTTTAANFCLEIPLNEIRAKIALEKKTRLSHVLTAENLQKRQKHFWLFARSSKFVKFSIIMERLDPNWRDNN
jgi:hypothetical protein